MPNFDRSPDANDGYFKNLTLNASHRYDHAVEALAGSDQTQIAHLDSGVAPHPALNWHDWSDPAPNNILLHTGRNFFDPGGEFGALPVSPLTRSPSMLSGFLEYPAHGVKTLSVILSDRPGSLVGIARGVTVVPYRIANGPLFRDSGLNSRRDAAHFNEQQSVHALAKAISHATLLPNVKVMSISMGNPGWLGILEEARRAVDGRAGFGQVVAKSVDAAYEAGKIIVCAAGQVNDSVVYPAAYARTITAGGFNRTGQTYDHYPVWGYSNSNEVDVWAQAERINRGSYRLNGRASEPIHANEASGSERFASGTSYAAPQVASAAALWVHKYASDLEAMFGNEQWKIVEAFRTALREGAETVTLRRRSKSDLRARKLDIDGLLKIEPSAVSQSQKKVASTERGFW